MTQDPHKPRDPREPIPAQEARQGEIILGKRGRIVWIVALALMVILALVLGVAR